MDLSICSMDNAVYVILMITLQCVALLIWANIVCLWKHLECSECSLKDSVYGKKTNISMHYSPTFWLVILQNLLTCKWMSYASLAMWLLLRSFSDWILMNDSLMKEEYFNFMLLLGPFFHLLLNKRFLLLAVLSRMFILVHIFIMFLTDSYRTMTLSIIFKWFWFDSSDVAFSLESISIAGLQPIQDHVSFELLVKLLYYYWRT